MPKAILAFAIVAAALGIGYYALFPRASSSFEAVTASTEASYEELGKDLSLTKADIAAIARMFGAEESAESPAKGPMPTSLPLRLVGTISGASPFDGIATIESTEKKSVSTFFVGDEVLPGSVLVAVMRTRAVLRTGTVLEVLTIEAPKAPSRTASDQSPAPPPASAHPVVVPMEGVQIAGDTADVSATAFEELTTRRLPEILTQVLVSAVVEDGEMKGWRLSRIRPGSVFEQLGLKDGDVVTDINGFALGEPAKAIQALQALRTEKTFVIKTTRDGREVTKTVRVH